MRTETRIYFPLAVSDGGYRFECFPEFARENLSTIPADAIHDETNGTRIVTFRSRRSYSDAVARILATYHKQTGRRPYSAVREIRERF